MDAADAKNLALCAVSVLTLLVASVVLERAIGWELDFMTGWLSAYVVTRFYPGFFA